jgi:hypothetical protein
MCVLRASGERFNPDEFLRSSSLVALEVFHRGEPSLPRSKGELLRTSGFIVSITDVSWSDLPGQVAEVVAFLRGHKTEFVRLAADVTADDIRLRFPTNLRLKPNRILAQFDYLPPILLQEAGPLRMGIEMALYPPTWDGGRDAG